MEYIYCDLFYLFCDFCYFNINNYLNTIPDLLRVLNNSCTLKKELNLLLQILKFIISLFSFFN